MHSKKKKDTLYFSLVFSENVRRGNIKNYNKKKGGSEKQETKKTINQGNWSGKLLFYLNESGRLCKNVPFLECIYFLNQF